MQQNDKTISYYNKHAEEYYNQTVDVDMSDIYDQFLSHLESGAHILDAGCGSGRDSLYFIEQGYQVTAIDAAEELAQLAEDLIGQEVLTMHLEELNFKREFDGIWACASLLHLKSERIKLVLKKFAQALLAQGIIYVSLKAGAGEKITCGRYFNYYTEQEIVNLATAVEQLEVIKVWQTDDRKNSRSPIWFNLLLQKSG